MLYGKVRSARSPRVTTAVNNGISEDHFGNPVSMPSRTKQSMKAECDINNIMKKFIKTGAVAHVNKFAGEYGYAEATTFHEAMEVVRKGEEMFAELPAQLRAKFKGDPAEFLAFVQDAKNLAEMRELGLAVPEPPASVPLRVEVVNPAVPPV